MKPFITLISLCFLFVFGIYFFHAIYWIGQLNKRQYSLGENLPDTFRVERYLERDSNGYFCINVKVNDIYDKSFIIDTKASSLERIETLHDLGARYWDNYPVGVENTYGQKEKLPLYELESLSIGELRFQKPLINGISKTNAIHDLLYKGIIGKEIQKQMIWKFSLDENKLILLPNNDPHLLESETQGYHQIKNGLNNECSLLFPVLADSAGFHFDLGYQGEISIDKKLFNKLSGKYPCKKYLNARIKDRIDTTYVFEQVAMEWHGIKIPDCTLRYYPITNRNLLGAKFIQRFNFILGYQNLDDKRSADLYIQPRIAFETLTNESNSPHLGFDIGYLGDELFVTLIEINGLAEKAGLKVMDKVTEIDNGAIDLAMESVASGKASAYISRKKTIQLKTERAKIIVE